MARKHGFFDFKIDGLLFVDHILSFLKIKEKEALQVLKGVNATNLNRKIKKSTMQAAAPQNLDMNAFMKDKVFGGFKMRLSSKGQDHKYFNLGHPYITGRGATKKIVKSSKKKTWSITYAGMMSVLMYGRKEYEIPSEATRMKRNSRMPMMWKNKAHYAGKSGYSGGLIRGNRSLKIEEYDGINYLENARQDIEAWFEAIQEKFLSKGFNTINL